MFPPAAEQRSEIVFFDLETTVPSRRGEGHNILEFEAILVCPRRLVELHSCSTLVRPDDPSLISSLSIRCNGITPDAVAYAPSFTDIADQVFDILHGKLKVTEFFASSSDISIIWRADSSSTSGLGRNTDKETFQSKR